MVVYRLAESCHSHLSVSAFNDNHLEVVRDVSIVYIDTTDDVNNGIDLL